jgi:hypothetical protein
MILQDEEFLSRIARLQIEAGVPLDQLSAYTTGPDGNPVYLGNPGIVRELPTSADEAMFLSHNLALPPGELPRVPVGPIQAIMGDYRNISGRDISGYDLGFNWRFPSTSLGRFRLVGRGTYLARFDEQLDEFTPLTEERGKNNYRKWQGSFSLLWNFANLSSGMNYLYYGSSLETSAVMGVGSLSPEDMAARFDALGSPTYIVPTQLPSGEIRYYYKNPSWGFFNIYSRYTFRQRAGWLRGVHVRVGITNLTNRVPPVSDLGRGYRAGSLVSRGRAINVEVGKRF